MSVPVHNIPNEEGIEACRSLLDTGDVQEPPTNNIIKTMTLILKRNNLSFNDNRYLQIKRTAMGTCMAPSYANLFMGRLEQEFLLTQDKLPRVWWRYIGNIFAIWTHGILQ